MNSPREQVQVDLVKWLNDHSNTYDAPYGVIADMESLPKGGKVRTVTFGVARYLDATAFIWSPDKITVKARGALAYKFVGTPRSLAELIAVLE
jgi:hypothetical protein